MEQPIDWPVFTVYVLVCGILVIIMSGVLNKYPLCIKLKKVSGKTRIQNQIKK